MTLPRSRVLFVHGDARVRTRACTVLDAECDVIAVANADDALAHAQHAPPELVLADAYVLRRMREDPVTRELPIVVVCARADDALQAGADDYLVAPFSPRELRARVRASLALSRARHADRAKDRFLAMLGHELRNPLAPILTCLQVMRMTDRPTCEVLDILDRQVEHMTRLVEDLVEVSRLGRGKLALRRERVELADLIERARTAVLPRSERQHVRVEVNVARGLAIDADARRLAQVFAALFANALEQAPAGTRIGVDAERAGTAVRVRVCDEGAGAAPDALVHVFEPFMHGHGLALAIARDVIELHGGTIAATSAGANRGSVFAIELPAARSGGAAYRPTG